MTLPRTIFEPEHADFRDSVRGFLLREAVPKGADWEACGLVPREFRLAAARQGLVAFAAAEAHGGAGQEDFRFNVVLNEEIALNGVVGDSLVLTNDILIPYLIDLTSEDQQRRWLPGIASGEKIAAIAMSEPGAGSDLRGIVTTAEDCGDHFLLNGSKTFVSSGMQADLIIVAARIKGEERSYGLFMVESGMDGLRRGRKLEKVGMRAQDTAEIFLDGISVPATNLIGELGRGLHYLMRNLSQERLSIAITSVAAAERALALTLSYTRDRRAFGRRIADFQASRFTLAELAVDIQAARALVDASISAHCRQELSASDAAVAKLFATEMQGRVLDACVQLHGGYGYMEEYDVARMWRDARVSRIYGGTSEIMKEISDGAGCLRRGSAARGLRSTALLAVYEN